MKKVAIGTKMTKSGYKKGDNHFLSGFMLGLGVFGALMPTHTVTHYENGFRKDMQNMSGDAQRAFATYQRQLKSKSVEKNDG